MSSFHEKLLGLFPAQQLEALEKVRDELLRDPEALDTHSKKEKK